VNGRRKMWTRTRHAVMMIDRVGLTESSLPSGVEHMSDVAGGLFPIVNRSAGTPPTLSWLLVSGRTKISSFDPMLPAVFALHTTQPLLALFHPPIELASWGPRGRLDLDRWVDYTAVSFSKLL
jgi:hypothetical protein